jgi:hypothetical protein
VKIFQLIRYSYLRSLIACAMLLLAPSYSTADGPTEYQVKAAFIYQFTKYVKWPGGMSLDSVNQMNICIWGSNPFGDALAIFDKASNAKLRINVIKSASAADLPKCHMLFVGKSAESGIASVIAQSSAHPILTISEVGGFAGKGGMIEMQTVEKSIGVFSRNNISLIINAKSAQKSSIQIDAQLLEIAQSVIR